MRILRPAQSVQPEIYLYSDFSCHRFSRFTRRIEFPFLHGFDCFFIKAHAEASGYLDIMRLAI